MLTLGWAQRFHYFHCSCVARLPLENRRDSAFARTLWAGLRGGRAGEGTGLITQSFCARASGIHPQLCLVTPSWCSEYREETEAEGAACRAGMLGGTESEVTEGAAWRRLRPSFSGGAVDPTGHYTLGRGPGAA